MDQERSQSHRRHVWAPVDAEATGVCVRLCREDAAAQGLALLSIASAEALRNPQKPQIGLILDEQLALERGWSPSPGPTCHPAMPTPLFLISLTSLFQLPQQLLSLLHPRLSRFHLPGLSRVWRSRSVALLHDSAQLDVRTQRLKRRLLPGSGAATPGRGPGPLLSLSPRLPATVAFQSKDHLPGVVQQLDPKSGAPQMRI